MKVKDCMCNEVCCVSPNSTIKDCAKLMMDNHIGCVPICDDSQKVVGVVTDRDIILRTIACDKDVKTTPVSDIMSCNVCCCTPNTDINEAEKMMSQNQIRRIPVCDCNNHVVGILTLGDLAHFDTQLGKQQVYTTFENICNCEGQIKNGN